MAASPADAASQDGVLDSDLAGCRAELGGIDVYFANAGIGVHGGPETPDDGWLRSWDVNVMAHVRAARLLIPDWLEAGRGHFVATVSAAGLLTTPGSAPYSVTKHAALAFAEWLSVTYGHRGLRVQALCPQGVRTAMLDSSGPVGDLMLRPEAIEAEDLAELVSSALADRPVPDPAAPGGGPVYAGRAADPDTWLAGMSKIQQSLEEDPA